MENRSFIRRIGPDPHLEGAATPALQGCPDIWELSDGSFAVIGLRSDPALRSRLPDGASCGPDEALVVVPRRILVGAKQGIPER